MGVLLKLGIVLVAGLIGGRLARMVKLPEVTGYLLSGLFLGPSLFNLISAADSASFSVISDVALAAIAFSIGSEFLVKDMKKLGRAIIIITLLEVVGAVFVVFFVVYVLFGQPFALAIVIASMSAGDIATRATKRRRLSPVKFCSSATIRRAAGYRLCHSCANCWSM